MIILDLDDLKNRKISGISAAAGSFLAEAAMVCLSLQGHSSGILLSTKGEIEGDCQIIWSNELTRDITDSWTDLKEATEYGATAIAILLVDKIVHMERIKRNIGAADYVIINGTMNNNQRFEPTIYLEISGIFESKYNNSVMHRVNQKILQVQKKIAKVPFLVCVVEFSNPKAKIISRR